MIGLTGILIPWVTANAANISLWIGIFLGFLFYIIQMTSTCPSAGWFPCLHYNHISILIAFIMFIFIISISAIDEPIHSEYTIWYQQKEETFPLESLDEGQVYPMEDYIFQKRLDWLFLALIVFIALTFLSLLYYFQ